SHFSDLGVDIIVVDRLCNVFDGGEGDAGENDNAAMLFFSSNGLIPCMMPLIPMLRSSLLTTHAKSKRSSWKKIRFRHSPVRAVCEAITPLD
ncbi:hypothetical protein, partial [Bartonella sp. AC66GZZY]|uniref:hypothetical protein n=1 Tax=Bartonella sp. AC66GZZY TaxID=3243458 RepID=UPI0035CF90E6